MDSNYDAQMTPEMERWCNAWMDATGINDWQKAIDAYHGMYHTTNMA